MHSGRSNKQIYSRCTSLWFMLILYCIHSHDGNNNTKWSNQELSEVKSKQVSGILLTYSMNGWSVCQRSWKTHPSHDCFDWLPRFMLLEATDEFYVFCHTDRSLQQTGDVTSSATGKRSPYCSLWGKCHCQTESHTGAKRKQQSTPSFPFHLNPGCCWQIQLFISLHWLTSVHFNNNSNNNSKCILMTIKNTYTGHLPQHLTTLIIRRWWTGIIIIIDLILLSIATF